MTLTPRDVAVIRAALAIGGDRLSATQRASAFGWFAEEQCQERMEYEAKVDRLGASRQCAPWTFVDGHGKTDVDRLRDRGSIR